MTYWGLKYNLTDDTYERTYAAVGLEPGEDFDELAPWQLKRCNVADGGTVNAYYGEDGCYSDYDTPAVGQAMVELNKFWYYLGHWTTEGKTYYEWLIADYAYANWSVFPAFITDGTTHDHIYIGAYEASLAYSTLKAQSRAGVPPQTTLSRAQFRTYSAARGAGWSNVSIQTIAALQILATVENGDFNTQAIIGNGICGDTSAHFIGETAASGQYPSGNTSFGTIANQTTASSYRGIENLWGNTETYVDGINIGTDHIAYICDSPSHFADTNTGYYYPTYVTLPVGGGYITDIDLVHQGGYPGTEPVWQNDWFFLPKVAGGSDPMAYLCDALAVEDALDIVQIGGNYSYGLATGLYTFVAHQSTWGGTAYDGGRLQKV